MEKRLFELLEAIPNDFQPPKFGLLNEGVTYYNLRQFITLMINYTNDSDLRKLLKEVLIVLAKMEILNKPVPTIKKLKNVSPDIF